MLLLLKNPICRFIFVSLFLPIVLFSQDRGGDQIISFPIKLERNINYSYYLSFFYQRSDKIDYINRGWNDGSFVGPEPRIITNGILDSTASEPDALIVDFFFSDIGHLSKLANIPEDEWNNYPQEDGSFKKGKPALVLFGSGGYKIGYNFENNLINIKDSAYYNKWDDGIDPWFNFMALPLPKNLWAGDRNELYVRIRFRVYAKNHRTESNRISDDKDNFYIDRIKLEKIEENPFNIDIVGIKVIFNNPYTVIPFEQASRIPVSATIVNNSGSHARNSIATLSIKHSSVKDKWPLYRDNFDMDYYCKRILLSEIKPFEKVELNFPVFNANDNSEFFPEKGGRYDARLIIQSDFNYDTTYSSMLIDFADYYAYDPFRNPYSDVPEFSELAYSGLSLPAYSDGSGSFNAAFGNPECGHSGSIAIKFQLYQRDTLYGYMGYYAASGPEEIKYRIYYNNSNTNLPGEEVPGSAENALSGFDEISGEWKQNEYAVSIKTEPLILEPGTYWMAVEQLGLTGLYLGGSKYRAGMRTVNYSDSEPLGDEGNCLLAHKEFRVPDSTGNLLNMSLFAYNNFDFDNKGWVSFTPSTGNPAYAHLDHSGISRFDSLSRTYSRGTFIPMIRPFFGYSHLVSVEDEIESNDFRVISYPNPCNGIAIFKFNISTPCNVKLNITNIEGKTVYLESGKYFDSGTHIIKIDMSDKTSGLYFYSFISGDKSVSGKIVLIK